MPLDQPNATGLELPDPYEPLFQPARYKAFFGGRGGAKSHSFAQALLVLGGQKPLRIMCAREVQTSIKDSVKQLLDDKIRQMGVGDFFHSTQSEIRGFNGTDFIFAGLGKMTADQIKSAEGVDIVWVEEAQTISRDSLEILIPTIRRPGSELWFSWNPRHTGDPVDMRFRGDNVPADSVVRKINYDENPYLPAELRAEMEYDRIHNRERFAHIWLGEYEPMAIGAIWNRMNLAQYREAPRTPDDCEDLERILVAVDHAISSKPGANEHGIIVGGLDKTHRGHVLEDATTTGAPDKWATRAIAMYDKWEADGIVVEINQGGDLVKNTIATIRSGIPIYEVHASRGKHIRAEPVAAQYALGMIVHDGTHARLEDQMCLMTNAGWEGPAAESPDRVDAMVWLWTELFPQLTTRRRRAERKAPKPPALAGAQQAWMK